MNPVNPSYSSWVWAFIQLETRGGINLQMTSHPNHFIWHFFQEDSLLQLGSFTRNFPSALGTCNRCRAGLKYSILPSFLGRTLVLSKLLLWYPGYFSWWSSRGEMLRNKLWLYSIRQVLTEYQFLISLGSSHFVSPLVSLKQPLHTTLDFRRQFICLKENEQKT